MFTGITALLASSVQRLGLEGPLFGIFRSAALAFFVLSVLVSLLSFADYLKVYRDVPK
jgi:CDP-diacylglycerol--glycerol-3-phosphate 3-phosphatidyltransferase